MTDTAAPASPLPPKPYVQIVQTPEKPEKQHSLIATARELTWLQVTVDNNDPAEVLLREGESTRWLADSKITIVVGNAGGVDLTYNGKLLESLGTIREGCNEDISGIIWPIPLPYPSMTAKARAISASCEMLI